MAHFQSVESGRDSWLVSLCYGLSLLGRRALATAALSNSSVRSVTHQSGQLFSNLSVRSVTHQSLSNSSVTQ